MEEKQETKKSNKIMFIIFGVIILLLVCAVVFLALKLNNNQAVNISNSDDVENIEEIEIASDNIALGSSTTSFANMKSTDENFTDAQQEVLKYFDNNYINFNEIMGFPLLQFPQLFKGGKIQTNAIILKVLKSTDDEYEVLAVQGGKLGANAITGELSVIDDYGYTNMSIETIPEDKLMIIKGKQLNKRMIKGDIITLYGECNDNTSIEIDSKNYVLPTIKSINVVQLGTNIETTYKFNIDTIKPVAEVIFGKDIKISKPILGEDYESETYYALDPYYKITLDNQSNANFSSFKMYREDGRIEYNNVSDGTIKRLYISADFQHYIVTTYDKSLKHIYVDYFDRDLKKLWNREFDYVSNDIWNSSAYCAIDYTTTQMSIVIDNDLYLIDLATGENVINPVMVGTKTYINMMTDGILLIGNDNKDTVIKVDYEGNFIFRTNGNSNYTEIFTTGLQVVNGKILVELGGICSEDDTFGTARYLLLNSNGTVEASSEDLGIIF